MVLPLLFVPLVYGLSSTPDACAAPKDPKWDTGTCYNWEYSALRTCCWQEPDILNPGETIAWCQTCNLDGTNCGAVYFRSSTGPLAPPQDGVLEEPLTTLTTPTPTPILTPTTPPLFGRNEGAVPPTGGIEQPFTSTPFQQIPQGTVQGQDQPFIQSETPPTLSPLPTPPPPLPPPTQTGPTVAPQDSQDDEGGGLPVTENQENVPLDDGVAEQPEDNGQGESEGAETAGPLT